MINQNGDLLYLINIARDITQLQKMERQLQQAQKLESIGTLAGGIAHDFNNILSAILGYTDLAFFDVEENSPVYKNLSGIKQAGNRAKDLVKQILTISRHDDTEPTLIHIATLVQDRPEEHPPPDSDKALPRGTEQILLVDDEPTIIEIMPKSLEHLGYTITAATGSQKALEIFKKSPDRFDLVITDMTMPDMTGDRLAREVKAVRSDMPVILCTGFSEKINGQEKNLDIDAFFMKPVDRVKMAETVRKVLDEAKG